MINTTNLSVEPGQAQASASKVAPVPDWGLSKR